MAILIAGWDPKWVEEFAELIRQHFESVGVAALHHKNCERRVRLFAPWVEHETGRQRIFEEDLWYASLTRGVVECLEWLDGVHLFVLSTDFGFRSVTECVRAIRLRQEYRLTPILIHHGGSPVELEKVSALGVSGVVSGYDISPVEKVIE